MKTTPYVLTLAALALAGSTAIAETAPCSQVIADLGYDSLNSPDAALEEIAGNMDSRQGFGQTVTTNQLRVAQWNTCQMALVIAERGDHKDLIVKIMAYGDGTYAGFVTSKSLYELQ
jgi:hypothetical protein